MTTHRFLLRRLAACPLALVIAILGTALPAHAARPMPPDHWVGTWATGSVSLDNKDNRFASDTTLRQIVHVSLGGPLVRIEFTNQFGTEPLTLGAAHIALTASGDAISLMSANALTFGGKPSITIPPGATAISDPAALNLPAFADLTVTLFLPGQKITHPSGHPVALQTNYAVAGNLVGAASFANAAATRTTNTAWLFLKAVDVRTPADSGAVVAFGDSITDGYDSTPNTNNRWPDLLARRLAADKKARTLAVLNEGISANRVLHDGYGPSALARFDADVLALPGVRYLIVLEGINDIGHAADPNHPYDPITADALIQGLAQLTERAHTHNIKVFGATLTPYIGAGYASPAGDAIRQAYNQWIRTSNLLDGFIDFDQATRDQSNPTIFARAADSGDHLHPGDAGYKTMANAINLNLFLPSK